ncbi:MAG: TetR/AcrR family transcriptional regulator [Bacteroidales bacterium]|jgi:AcrR family transcriptional regulator|nr:TetR/AcrR family transcriptional regulator [Bacteroidales bacterium]
MINVTNSKEQILHTALKLFLKNSYKDVSLRDIVNEVGLTKGAFYHYYESKEKLFEDTVKHFYNNMIIADYKSFPKTSLKEFYEFYLKKLQEPDEFDELDDDMNLFIFISEASKRLPAFQQIHNAHHQKEIWEWSKIIETAKRKKEIKTFIPNEELACMFLNLSDGALVQRTTTNKTGAESLTDIKRDWDNLYNLLKVNKR